MSFPDIRLDDRHFQDIVDECRRLIPRYCPEWTDHNLTDPGITLLELFAWMTEVILYRLNRVPEKNYLKFLELIGLKLQPPSPAKAQVTFTLSAAQKMPVVIPAGTEVSTVRTETEEAIIFCTERDLAILPPTLENLLVSLDEDSYEEFPKALEDAEEEVGIFNERPRPNDAFYLGFRENISSHQLLVSFKARIEGIGVKPNDPPICWEIWHPGQAEWIGCEMESDSSGGFNRDGDIILHLPAGGGMLSINGQRAFWLRCRATVPKANQPGYSSPPRLSNIQVASLGGTTPAVHSMKVKNEVMGISSGKPGQVFKAKNKPLLPRGLKEYVEIGFPGEKMERWKEVGYFSDSGPDDPHYTVDEVMGEVQLGPTIRHPGGGVYQYGRVPPEGMQVRFRQYRYGGGVTGNVGADTITVLKSSIPYVARVRNMKPATGGADAESVEQAKVRGPHLIKTINRAVTAEDYEYLARDASPAVARAKCIQPAAAAASGVEPGLVHLYLVPALKDDQLQPSFESLDIPEHLKQAVYQHLNPRRLLTTMLIIKKPEYCWVSVELLFKAAPRQEIDESAKAVKNALYRYFHPLRGGKDGKGWPFGKEIFLPELFSFVQQMEEVEYIERLLLFRVDPETQQRSEAGERIFLNAWCLPYAYEHIVMAKE